MRPVRGRLVLGHGCCCNKEIVDALTNCVKGDAHTDKAA